jgi:hypothetical protein
MKNLKAYHGKPALKAKYLSRVRRHREADELIKGQYWQNGKGCAVGCTLEDRYNEAKHMAYETDLGIPEALAHLEDSIFEGLPNAKAMLWPERFLASIRPGADLTGVADKFLLALLVDKKHGCVRHADEQGRRAIMAVAVLLRRKIAGKTITAAEWNASAARAAEQASFAEAAAFAARAAAAPAYASAHAARAAAHAAAHAARAARPAAYAAYAAYAASAALAAASADSAAPAALAANHAARYAARIWQADTLIAQLQAA